MHFDPERYPDPEKFNVRRLLLRTFDPSTHIATRWHANKQPDRYLGDHHTNAESANLADPMLRDHWMFGAGSVF